MSEASKPHSRLAQYADGHWLTTEEARTRAPEVLRERLDMILDGSGPLFFEGRQVPRSGSDLTAFALEVAAVVESLEEQLQAERREEWREGIVNVLDHEGYYLGCMGSETWAWTLDGGIKRMKEQYESAMATIEVLQDKNALSDIIASQTEDLETLERERDEARLLALDSQSSGLVGQGQVAQARYEQRRYQRLLEQLEVYETALKRIASGDFIRKDAYVIARDALNPASEPAIEEMKVEGIPGLTVKGQKYPLDDSNQESKP